MGKIKYVAFALMLNFSIHAQWDTTTVSNEVSTTDEIVGPVLRISNEIRIPNSFFATDPTIGTLDNSHYGINLHKTNGIGFAFNGIHQMVFKPNGDVGIGTASPSGKLHVSSGTNGDAILRLEADTDNNDEFDNPLIQLRQDGDLVGVNMGFHSTNFGHNIFGIGAKHSGQENWDVFTINTINGNIGIGTINPDEKMHINGTATITGDIGIANDSHWKTGYHTMELQNSDAGDVILSFHRAGHTNAAIKHSPLGGLIFSGSGGYDANHVFLKSNGDFGIGTTVPDSKLTVKGNIHAEEVKVDLSVPGPDYVFKEEYDLKSLEEVQNYIKEHGHLPNIPSAKEMEESGIQLGQMNMKLLEKIEELTLYTLEQEEKLKEIDKLKDKVAKQEDCLKKLEQLLNRIR